MNGVFIIPTGIGCEIGGHAGDATSAAKLVASVCDKLIIHPNVVNASDINEMTENMLYVEGSTLDKFLEGSINLKLVKSNKILLVVNAPVTNEIINSVSAARATIGADIEILELNAEDPFHIRAFFNDKGIADGELFGLDELINKVNNYKFDVLTIASKIFVDENVALNYVDNGGVNPWGGAEARVSRVISERIGRPTFHSPFGHTLDNFDEVVDPRMAAEFVSVSYLHCILKGAHKAPKMTHNNIGDLSYKDIDFMVSPFGCYGKPHRACFENSIPVIIVKENNTICNYYGLNTIPKGFILVENYLEAIGVIQAMKCGISLESIRRPLSKTKVMR